MSFALDSPNGTNILNELVSDSLPQRGPQGESWEVQLLLMALELSAGSAKNLVLNTPSFCLGALRQVLNEKPPPTPQTEYDAAQTFAEFLSHFGDPLQLLWSGGKVLARCSSF